MLGMPPIWRTAMFGTVAAIPGIWTEPLGALGWEGCIGYSLHLAIESSQWPERAMNSASEPAHAAEALARQQDFFDGRASRHNRQSLRRHAPARLETHIEQRTPDQGRIARYKFLSSRGAPTMARPGHPNVRRRGTARRRPQQSCDPRARRARERAAASVLLPSTSHRRGCSACGRCRGTCPADRRFPCSAARA